VIGLWAGLLLWGQQVANAGENSWQSDYMQAILAGVLLIGVFVSFGLDRLGRPRDPEGLDDEHTRETAAFDTGTGLFEPTLPDATPANR
jgi:hypothetical protein